MSVWCHVRALGDSVGCRVGSAQDGEAEPSPSAGAPRTAKGGPGVDARSAPQLPRPRPDAAAVSQVRERIEAQNATIGAVAKQEGEAKKITEELSAKSEDADKKLKAMDDAQQTATFAVVVQAALNDDRPSFDKLWALAEDKKSPFQARAPGRIVPQAHQPLHCCRAALAWRCALMLTMLDLQV